LLGIRTGPPTPRRRTAQHLPSWLTRCRLLTVPAASNRRPPSGGSAASHAWTSTAWPATPPTTYTTRPGQPAAGPSSSPPRRTVATTPAPAPITRASGKSRVVLAHARSCRLADATYQCAVAARTRSPAARQLYDHQRGPRSNPHAALRALANRLVGVLHGCLRHSTASHEAAAWPRLTVTNHPHRRSCCLTRYERGVLDLLRWLPDRVLNPSPSVAPAGAGRR